MNDIPLIQRVYLRYEGVLQFFLVISVSVGLYILTLSNDSAKTRREYIQIAVGILSQEETSSGEKEPIRKWAVDILDSYSPIPLTEEQKEALIKGVAKIYRYDYGGYDYTFDRGRYDTDSPQIIPPGGK